MIIYRLYSVINIKMFLRAIDGARTRGLDLGKVARYQLRHYRIYLIVPMRCFPQRQNIYYYRMRSLSNDFLENL